MTNGEMKTIDLRIPDKMYEEIRWMVQTGNWKDQSELVRDAIRRLSERQRELKGERNV